LGIKIVKRLVNINVKKKEEEKDCFKFRITGIHYFQIFVQALTHNYKHKTTNNYNTTSILEHTQDMF